MTFPRLLEDPFRSLDAQTTAPKTFPIPAVNTIAKAPQNVILTVARRIFAPPALAPMAPRRARKPKDAPKTMGTSKSVGETTNHKQRHGGAQ